MLDADKRNTQFIKMTKMKKLLLIFILMLILFYLNYDDKNKYQGKRENYVYTEKACNLFIEYYLVFTPKGWGVENSLYGVYLTDSLYFRKYLGESKNFINNNYKCKNDSIFFITYKDNLYSELNKKYDLKKLKKTKNLNEQ